MIRDREPLCTFSDSVFTTALNVIAKSSAAQQIDDHYQHSVHPGGRRSGIRYTSTAVLVALLVRFLAGLPYSLRGAMDTIGAFTPQQLSAVGMADQDCAAIHSNAAREYKRFHRFWALRMQPLDPDWDLPSRRMTNAEFKALLRKRSEQDRHRCAAADERLTRLINDLLYGSVNNQRPNDCDGDAVVDETIINTAGPGGTLGVKDVRYRGASSIAKYWVREKDRTLHNTEITAGPGGPREIKASGFGVGATFVTRVARRDALHAEPPVFIGMDVHAPTGASIQGLATALAHAHRTGLDARREGRTRWPLLTADMGYNNKTGFGELMLTTRYSPVVRYPSPWSVSFPSANPPGAPVGPPPGPIHYAGAFYCPAVADRIHGHRTPKTEELLKHDNFRTHDRRLRAIYPFLMGHHTRPTLAAVRRGRPRLGDDAPIAAKVRLVCPAALGAVKCPLKPESLNADTVGIPLAQPDWAAHDLACCAKSSTTVTLTADQLRLAQWDLVPGSWEHTLYFEAARALTEQRFSQLKSKYVAGLDELTTGPRRTPMIKIAIALAAVTANIRAQQDHHRCAARRQESIDIRMRQLTADLGHPPARIPPRS
ncbi:hypothetical protein [Mycolicibacterium austroafricanum]|uniref:hypothetical protein n=1 Tax=Mycolicibacterium austroafricanum TaxID=39687 RepID=UPI000CF99A54|nr:hypothetical protein [Mycolicibacterium austroafricanum]PQP51741.1 hypothetical protein C6A88_07455 [Mycolicibacterium austroafricanum]